MPLFDFCCEKCDVVIEHLITASDPVPVCDNCKVEMAKILGAPSDYTGAKTAWVNKKLGTRGKIYKD